MFWAIENPDRLLQEKRAMDDLAASAEWLHAVRWALTKEVLLKVDADITIGHETFAVELVYPSFFPDTPAFVRPRSATKRWSSHQYGPGGVLCLEWGPDNWSATVTGANLLESTYRLLCCEHGTDETRQSAPSRHRSTFGQEVRLSTARIVYTPAIREYLRGIPSSKEYGLAARTIFHSRSTIVFISEVSRTNGDSLTATDIPTGLLECGPLFAWSTKGHLFKSDDFNSAMHFASCQELLDAIHEVGFTDFKLLPTPTRDDENIILLVAKDAVPRAFSVKAGENTIEECTVIDSGEEPKERRPPEYRLLSEKKVGIVGLGSVGSKVAVSLARCGVRKFLLVDDDVMLARNISRNELNWASVGENKADAVKEALLLIGPGIEVQIRPIRIAGQESPEVASTVLDALANCDLLIDATASASVLVQLAAVAKRRKTPLIWGEVFAGGIGGLLVRSRPGKDLEPLDMRSGVHQYLRTLPKAPFRLAAGYDADSDAAPIIAFDAEVTQFAATLTAFALDTLLLREPSAFPYSAYLIGYKSEWIFEAPFHTQPILVNTPGVEAGRLTKDETEPAQPGALLADVIIQQDEC